MTRSTLSVFAGSQKLRRAFALTAVVLATGGLVLYKAPTSSAFNPPSLTKSLVADGKNATSFQGPGVHGTLSLSHAKVLSGTTTPVFAEVRVQADPSDTAKVRAPISLAVVLDTSGSMSGDKIRDAKNSIVRLLSDMRDDDEIAMIHYASTSEVIQPLTRLGSVRDSLIARVNQLSAGGGTNIPEGLRSGQRALDDAGRGRVRRIVLVSDGLDSTRNEAEDLARSSFGRGITVSSLGIGNDFDESYMGAVAQDGHGNFAFVKEGSSIASFLKRELEESATTTIENARVHLEIPNHMRFVSATGADATLNRDSVDLRLGAMFAGDEQRVVVELASDGSDADIAATASWSKAGTDDTLTTKIPTLSVVATNDAGDVERGRDGNVFASAVSVTASKRQLAANEAYARGDVATATALANQNVAALQTAAAVAPMAAPTINAQLGAYAEQKEGFASAPPSSPIAKARAKSATVNDVDNLRRANSFWLVRNNMKKIAFIVAAGTLFFFAPFANRFGAVPASVALVWMGVLLAVCASASMDSISLSIGTGALGALANGVLASTSPAVAGAVLVAAAFGERTTRVRSQLGRAVHVLLALVGGALGGSLSHAYSVATLPVMGVAVVVAAVLASLPLLVEADDPVAHALDVAAGAVTGSVKATLVNGAELRRTSSEVPLDRATAERVKTTWQSLLRLANARIRLERTRPAALMRFAETLTQQEGPPSPPSAADAVVGMLDQKIAEHVTVLARAYTAVDTVTAARIGLDDSALKTVESMGDNLEEQSRALVEVR